MVKVALVINERTVTSIPLLIASWFEKSTKVNVEVIVISRHHSIMEKVKTLLSLRAYDVVHTNQNYSAFWVSVFLFYNLIKTRKIKALHTLHSNLSGFNFAQKVFFYVIVWPLRSGIIVNSYASLHSIGSSKVRAKTKVILHAVDFTNDVAVRTIGKGPLKLIMASRLVAIKNHYVVLRAMTILEKMDVDCNLTICGKGLQKDAILGFIKQHKLEGRVVLAGELSRNEVLHHMTKSHFMITSSFSEGFGVATIEGMSRGCLPICSDIPVNREIVGMDSVFFDPNSPYDLAMTIKYFLDNTHIYDRKASDLAGLCRKFSKLSCIESYEKLYVSLG